MAISLIEEKLLEIFIKNPNSTFKLHQLAKRLSLYEEFDIALLRNTLKNLVQQKKIKQVSRKKYGYLTPPKSSHLKGVFTRLKSGAGIVKLLSPEEGTVFVQSMFTNTALDEDIVNIALFPVKKSDDKSGIELTGEVTEILKRGRKIYTGIFQKSKNFFFVIPDTLNIGMDIFIPHGKTSGARPDEKVAFVIEEWKNPNIHPEGKIINRLGKSGEINSELLSLLYSYGLSYEFPKKVIEEVNNYTDQIPKGEIEKRVDLRDLICFTIDPEDAKDFDDAVSLEQIDEETYELGVHIADVSHYVKENSELDKEAYKRGTSVYLADSVVPMLPEKLSNNICSLIPNRNRLAYSILIEITKDATVKRYKIFKSIIQSKMRFTYEEVQEIIESEQGPFVEKIIPMHQLSKKLFNKRKKMGSIDFETSEIKFKFDKDKKPIEIVKKERKDSNRMIEEFMLLANRLIAEHIAKSKKPFIYRIHDKPEPTKIKEVAEFVSQFGYSLKIDHGVNSKSIQKLLDQVKGTEEEAVINDITIRAMAKAIYSDENIGHFGLGFKYYTHFTSPIRRYPDLIVHRLLEEYSQGISSKRIQKLNDVLPDICEQSTIRERVAMDAERDSVKILQIEYMKRHIGDVYRAVISGILNFGIFVEIIDLLVEGLVRVRDLEDDYYIYDEKNYCFIGRSTKKRYRLGDKVKVQVVRVDLKDKEIDFKIVD